MRCPSIRFVEPETLALFDCSNQPSERFRVEAGFWPLLCPIATRRRYQRWPVMRKGFSFRFPVVDSCSEGGRIRVFRDSRTDRVLPGKIRSRKMRAESRRVPVAFQVWRSQRRSQGHVAEGLSFVVVEIVGIQESVAGWIWRWSGQGWKRSVFDCGNAS